MDEREERGAEPPAEAPLPDAAPDAAAAEAPAAGAEPDYKDKWLRAEADFQNFRRRASRDREEQRRAVEDAALLEMIAALDDLDRAMESAPATVPAAWLDGVRLVGQRMLETLSRYGVTALDPAGAPFDPVFHEALLEIDAPDGVPPGRVVQVVHRGYARGDRALRPARVVVARAPAGESG